MAPPPYSLLEPVLQGTYAHLATHPSYYAFYGLYADYIRNHRWFSPREQTAHITHMLTTVQPVVALESAFHKSLPLRFFSRVERLKLRNRRDVRLAWLGLQNLANALGTPNTKRVPPPICQPTRPLKRGAPAAQTTWPKGRRRRKTNPFCYQMFG